MGKVPFVNFARITTPDKVAVNASLWGLFKWLNLRFGHLNLQDPAEPCCSPAWRRPCSPNRCHVPFSLQRVPSFWPFQP